MITEQDQDTRKLGRWSYITITGQIGDKTTFSTCYCPVRGTSPASAYSWQPYKYITMNNNKGPATKRIGKIPVWILIVVIFVSVWPYLVDHITTCIFYQWSMLCMFFCCVAWNAYTSRRIASNNSFYFWVAAPRVTFLFISISSIIPTTQLLSFLTNGMCISLLWHGMEYKSSTIVWKDSI